MQRFAHRWTIQVNIADATDKLLEECFDIVYEEYRKLSQAEEPDPVAKGKKLIEKLRTRLVTRYADKKASESRKK